MATVIEQLEAMRNVKENWDGEGAAAPEEAIIAAAVEFWRGLQSKAQLPDPYVTPNRIGGVLFAWEFGPHQLEVELVSADKASFVYLDRDTEESATGTVSLNRTRVRPSLAIDAILAAMPVGASS